MRWLIVILHVARLLPLLACFQTRATNGGRLTTKKKWKKGAWPAFDRAVETRELFRTQRKKKWKCKLQLKRIFLACFGYTVASSILFGVRIPFECATVWESVKPKPQSSDIKALERNLNSGPVKQLQMPQKTPLYFFIVQGSLCWLSNPWGKVCIGTPKG